MPFQQRGKPTSRHQLARAFRFSVELASGSQLRIEERIENLYLGAASDFAGGPRVALLCGELRLGEGGGGLLAGRAAEHEALHALLLLIALLLLALGLWQIIRRGRTIQGAVAIAVAIAVALIWVVTDSVPGDITPFAPHLTTLLVLAFASQRLRPPKSIGQVYRKGEGH